MNWVACSDTQLFGAKVLSIPGFLTPKNVLDIEHNLVGGKTTWKHQKAYAKMLIAGYLNQAKSIFEKYDDILYGPTPEKLAEETHLAVRDLLTSPECKVFLSQVGKADKSAFPQVITLWERSPRLFHLSYRSR